MKKQINKTVFLFLGLFLLMFSSCVNAQDAKAELAMNDPALKVWSFEAPNQEWVSVKINRIQDETPLTALNWKNINIDTEKAEGKYTKVASVEEIVAANAAGLYFIEGQSDEDTYLDGTLYFVYDVKDSIKFFSVDGDETAAAIAADYEISVTSTDVISLSLTQMWRTTGIYGFLNGTHDMNVWAEGAYENWREDKAARDKDSYKTVHSAIGGWGNIIMICVGFTLLLLAIKKGFEPLLLVPIGIGAILANVPFVGIASSEGFIGMLYNMGVQTGLFPLLIFMGVGAMTDFGPLLANPKTLLLGAAAQFGIFFALMGAVVIGNFVTNADGTPFFTLFDAAAIGIIGGADGPTAIFVARKLSPDLLGAIAVAAYSYMALVPVIQPPFMKMLTTKKERVIKMEQLRTVTKTEKIVFPLVTLTICILLLPDATPLLGALLFGNLAKECGVVDRLSDTMQNALINTVTIFLGLSVGSKMSADKFLVPQTLGILALGVVAFIVGTCTGILFAKLMNKISKTPINPLIGSAGVSAVPMAARVSNKVGQEANPQNFLLMHAMGPNVAGVIGSAVAAGVLLNLVPFLAG